MIRSKTPSQHWHGNQNRVEWRRYQYHTRAYTHSTQTRAQCGGRIDPRSSRQPFSLSVTTYFDARLYACVRAFCMWQCNEHDVLTVRTSYVLIAALPQ